jgi:LPXTG-motif cell wall-anchored protein
VQEWIVEIMEQYGYIGIFLMIALENVFPPIPSEVILTFGGFMTTYTNLSVPGVATVATAGSVAGAIILYGVGRLLSVERLEGIVERWGGILRVTKEDLHRASDWFNRYGYWTVLFCRMIPLVRSLISIPAGMAKMDFRLFLLFTVIGTALWNIILVSLGAVLGDSWDTILEFMDVYSHIAYAVIGLGIVAFALWFYRKKRKSGSAA